MFSICFRVIIVAVLLAAVGCTSSRQFEELQLQVNVLEQQNRAIEEKLISADSLNRTLLEALHVFKARTEFADEAGDARLEEISAKQNDILDRVGRLQQSLTALEQGLVRAPAVTEQDSASDTAAAGFTYTDARRIFDSAFKDLTSGDYNLAVLGFTEYIKTFPETDLTDDAQFWIGECHYRQKDFGAAKDGYALVEKNYTDSDKLASALYKLGRCYEEMGDTAGAKKYFEDTVAKFPDTQEAELANDKLQKQTE